MNESFLIELNFLTEWIFFKEDINIFLQLNNFIWKKKKFFLWENI